VQAAVDAADEPSDVIKVANGTYTDVSVRPRVDITTTGVATQVVYISKTVTIRGGYTAANWVSPDPDSNPTTLDAQGRGRVLYITGDISPSVEGLRLIGGDATGLGGDAWNTDAGGGVYIITATATVEGCEVIGNSATWSGGGLYLHYSGAVLSRNTIATNTADTGGGLFIQSSPAELSGNTIRSNSAARYGGGLFLNESAHAELVANTFLSNTAVTESGGGLALFHSPSSLRENVIISNTAAGWGGGVLLYRSDAVLTNTVLLHNRAYTRADGIEIHGSSPHLFHSTVAGANGGTGICVTNSGPILRGVAFLTNTILVSHSVGISVTSGNTVTINGILWDASTPVTVSNDVDATVYVMNAHTGDPAFAPDGYHLTAASDAIDLGLGVKVSVDIDGQSRPNGIGHDLGADELDESIVGLSATNDSPTLVGSLTTLTATVIGGSNVSYLWEFGDGAMGSGAVVAHSYPAVGVYTAVITATNSVSTVESTTVVTITEAPIAGLTASNDSPTQLGDPTTMTATISTGSSVSYLWAFGDGASDSGPVAAHEYPAVGVYTAVVTASNSVSVVAATTIVTITDAPITGLAAVNDSPTQLGGLTTMTATITTGSNVSFTWDFGDGETDSGAVVTYIYQQVGVYEAVVSSINSVGVVTTSTTVTVTDVPMTGLAAVNDSPTELGGLTTMTATISAGTNVIYVWAFGDGASDSGLTVGHIYPTVGVYAAVVTASNSLSVVTATTPVTITDVPIEGLVATSDSPTPLGRLTTMTATITVGSNVLYAWTFGDGEGGSGPTPAHTYPSIGTFTATVSATNGVGVVVASTVIVIESRVYLPLILQN
jgi:hypothetical protein